MDAPPVEPMRQVLEPVQRGLEKLYRLAPELHVGHFLIDRKARDAAGVLRQPGEQLLLQEDEDGLAIGLFLDPELLKSLPRGDLSNLVAELLHHSRFGEFMMLVEGVSHFLYVAFNAGRNQKLSALELELQAEVDKYATCLLSTKATDTSCSSFLRKRLFENFEYLEGLSADESERYRVANDNAQRYSQSLERRFVGQGKINEMLGELRRFYRMSLPAKMRWIRQAA